ncbi:hypothetical protein TNCV_2403111 [Trichonephila clavipes]|uniref:Uncharacterized protein n=1 Tax=Trichonephila clavipes TaxID=2585209 RepID=A0A8X6R0S2_TRICX|nr:hypothetical protein TNCV_2403111 [Trichonephila clavipes]
MGSEISRQMRDGICKREIVNPDKYVIIVLSSVLDKLSRKRDEDPVAGEPYKPSLIVVPRQNKGITVVVLKQSATRFPRTQLRSIRVNNWDISLTENRQCSWKS